MAAYTSGDDLLLKERYADIAFLDVEMPGRSGIHVGARLKEYNPKIKVFIVTSFPDYLDEAMRFQVFRYLSKPIDKSRLFRNLKDAVYLHNMETHVIPETNCQGLFNQIHKKGARSTVWLLTPRLIDYIFPFSRSLQRYA